jgi:hypothetical protein
MTLDEGMIGDTLLEIAEQADIKAKRFWLAGMAMQALVQAGSHDVRHISRQSFAMADEMLEMEVKTRVRGA